MRRTDSAEDTFAADGFVLRRAGREDVGEVRAVVRAAYGKWVPLLGREPLPMGADYERAVLEHRLDVLVTGSEIVAVLETMIRPDHLWIENVAVKPERQGQGLGRRLLAHAEDLARAGGLQEVRLLTSATFETNIALYGRVGYEVERTEPFMGGTTVYMRKAL